MSGIDPTGPPGGDGEGRIAAAFARARDEGRAALVVYLTACYPDASTSRACIEAAVDAGADVVEVGLPFSDPIMDGPIIQAANQHVLDAGTTITDELALVASLSDLSAPRLVMTYVTVPDTRGFARFAAECAAAGVAGVVLPDLPVVEAEPWLAAARAEGLATVFLASSVSSDERLDAIARASSGWVYAVGLLGVTGVDEVDDEPTRDLVARLRARTELPIAVGIGVRDAAAAARVASYADGVIVGSAVVRAVAAGDPVGAPGRVRDLVTALRRGVERRGAGGR